MEEDIRHKAICDCHKVIIEIYEEKELKSLLGPKGEFDVNGRQILEWFFAVVRKGQNKYNTFNFHMCFDDLIVTSDEIMHFTALLYLYAPYINNPIHEGIWFANRMVYPNRQNLEAKRFCMFVNTVNEKVYNYWDRIGDLIATYFPDKIDPKRVFFPTVIDIIPDKFHESPNYKWLKQFRDNEYKAMNEKRKKIVHYLTFDTDFKHKHSSNFSNKTELEKIIKERDDMPEFFKNQIKLTLDGFEKTVLLIEEITASELGDLE